MLDGLQTLKQRCAYEARWAKQRRQAMTFVSFIIVCAAIIEVYLWLI